MFLFMQLVNRQAKKKARYIGRNFFIGNFVLKYLF